MINKRFESLAALKGAILMTGSAVATYSMGLVINALIARDLGPEDYGRYAYVVWLVSVLILAANNGLTTTGIRFVAEALGHEAPRLAAAILDWLKRRQLASIAAVVAIFLVALPALEPAGWSGAYWMLAAVVSVAMATKAMFLFEISVAKGYGRYDIEAASSVSASLLSLILVSLFWWMDTPLNAYLILFAAISTVYFVVSAVMFRGTPAVPAEEGVETDFLVRMRKHLLWTIVMTIVGVFSGNSVPIYLLNKQVGPAEVGYFVIAASLSRGAIELVANGINTVLMPMMGHAFGLGGKDRVGGILSDSLRYLHFLGLLAAGVGAFWAEPVVLLVYGKAFSTATVILQWMLVSGGLVLGESAFGALLSATDHQRMRAGFAVFYLVVSVVVAIALIPPYGLAGAVAGYVGGRLAFYAVALAVVVKVMEIRLPLRELTRIFLASAFSAAVAFLLLVSVPEPWIGFPAGVVYGVLFLALSRYLSIWKEKDLRLITSLGEQHPRILGWTTVYFNRWLAGFER